MLNSGGTRVEMDSGIGEGAELNCAGKGTKMKMIVFSLLLSIPGAQSSYQCFDNICSHSLIKGEVLLLYNKCGKGLVPIPKVDIVGSLLIQCGK